MPVKIIEVNAPDALYCHYDGQGEPQTCYIELDLENGTLSADYDVAVGGGVPATVHNGIDRRYPIPILTGDAVNEAMRELLPLAERVHAGSSIEWDGRNNVGELDEDAKAAEEEIEEALGLVERYSDPNQGFGVSDLISIWDIGGVTNGCEVSEYGITAETTDERLDRIAIEIMDDIVSVSESSVAVCSGLHAYLRELRDGLEVQQRQDEN